MRSEPNDRPATPRSRSRRWAALVAAAACLTATVLATAGPAAAAHPLPIGDLGTAAVNLLTSPDKVAGANNWNCKPTRAHPYPVVLVHATSIDLGANWVALSPTLANAGYCVYAFNYGETGSSFGGRINGLGPIATSARTMSTFVDKVLRITGARQVDVVGHSQGGMMPAYYIKRLGGAPKVHTFVGLAPSNHGTTLGGLVTLGQDLNALGLVNQLFTQIQTPSLTDQEVGSDFETALFADGDTVPGVRYVVIETSHDSVVTPYTQAFLHGSNVTNILLQDQCPADPVSHVGLFLDSPAMQNVLNVLGPDRAGFQPVCTGYGPNL